jgi:aspartyl-tRNA synthetase
MKRTSYIKDVPRLSGTKTVVAGWIDNLKDLGKLKFIWLRDRTGTIQVTVVKGKAPDAVVLAAEQLGLHDFLSVEGVVPEKIQAKVGLEILPSKIEVLAPSERPLPLDVANATECNLETRLDWRPVDLRNPKELAVLTIQAKVIEGMEEFLEKEKCTRVFTPCIIGTPSESGSELFPVAYFDKTAYLRQDPQLHRQMLMVAGMDRIYDIGPSWRAESSHTPRHLCEHRGCAVEISFIDDETEVMRFEEQLVINAIKKVASDCKDELQLLNKTVEIPSAPFPELRFPQIYEILEQMGKKIPYGEDYDRESEQLLAGYVKKEYGHDFFFVNHFPFGVKPFYVMKSDEPYWARSVDLMYKGLEQSSGGQREHRYNEIVNQAKEKKMNLENLKWFTEVFKYGAPPHGGFNIGIERFTMQLLDLSNVREATPFPRAPERLVP